MLEKIIESKNCKQCAKSFDITQNDRGFYTKISPSFGGEKFQIPDPTLCPDCRLQRRQIWVNEKNLFRRKCDATGKDIISMYSPDKPYTVYDQDFWWSDAWDMKDSGIDFDFSEKFFSQFDTLLKSVPKRALVKGTGSENCDYANYLGGSKDSYFVFFGASSVNSMYINSMSDAESCNDCLQLQECSHCYEGIDIISCNNSYYIQDCVGCSHSYYLLDCANCIDCFACVGLRDKKYHIFNKEYTKEEYKKEKGRLMDAGYRRDDFLKFSLDFPRLNHKIIGSENVSGDMIYNSKNVHMSFEVYDAEDVSYGLRIYRGAYDCMDVTVGINNSNKLYEVSLANNGCYNLIFSHDCWEGCENLIYCTECKNSKNCFGCTGLMGKEYCILNTQYSKKEYLECVPRIISHMQETGEWGEFFPSSISPFGYNETKLMDFLPLEKNEAIRNGWNWSDYEAPFPKVDKIIPSSKLPKEIAEIPDDILSWAIECELTKKPFRIIRQELDFYRKHNLPIPRRHPDQRHTDRMKLRNPRKLHDRNCDRCNIEIQTTYSPQKPEKVYCETCYNKEMN